MNPVGLTVPTLTRFPTGRCGGRGGAPSSIARFVLMTCRAAEGVSAGR